MTSCSHSSPGSSAATSATASTASFSAVPFGVSALRSGTGESVAVAGCTLSNGEVAGMVRTIPLSHRHLMFRATLLSARSMKGFGFVPGWFTIFRNTVPLPLLPVFAPM